MAGDPTWPAILTNADWQSKKGNIAKIAGKTGVGEAMKAALDAFNKIDWKEMDAREIAPQDRDIDILKERSKAATAYYKSTIVPARDKVKVVHDLAQKTAAAWEKNKLIPSSSTKHAKAVTAAANTFYMLLKDNSSTMVEYKKTFDTMIAQKEKNAAEQAKVLDASIKNLETALKEVIKDPTKKGWSEGNTSAHQRCRSMCNAIRAIPALKARYWSTWQKYGDEFHRDAPDGEPKESAAIKSKIAQVIKSLATFKGEYKRVMGG